MSYLFKLLCLVHPESGKKDPMLSIAGYSVACVLLKFLLSGITVNYGANTLTFAAVDAMTIAAILTPTLGAVHLGTYVAKKKEMESIKVDGN